MYARDIALFRLCTYASAYLAGYDVDLNPLHIAQMRHVGEWVFFIPGPNGFKLAKSPNDWLVQLGKLGYADAWIGHEARHRAGLITQTAERRFIWSYEESNVSEDGHSWVRARCTAELLPTFGERPPYGLFEVAGRLRTASLALRAFATQAEHAAWLDKSVRLLDRLLAGGNADAIPPELRNDFPPVGFTDAARLLGAAAFQGDVIGHGGMGTWYDCPNQEEANPAERQALIEYGEAMETAVFAASQASPIVR